MKKLLLSFICLFTLGFTAQARMITVSNVPGSLAMFDNVQTAIDSARVGDTVFVQASKDSYGRVTINKRIVFLGEGSRPDFTGLSSWVGSITIDSVAKVETSGIIINGFYVSDYTGGYTFGIRIINPKLKGIVVKNCYVVNSSYNSSFIGIGHTIINNIFYLVESLGSNSIFSNNIVIGSISTGNNCVISNNIILGEQNSAFKNINGCTVNNNIFLAGGKFIETSVGNSFSKNMQGGKDLPIGNFTSTNFSNVFIETKVDSAMTKVEYLTASWKQKATSIGKAAGTDGKEIGVYGGNFPWPSNKIFNGDPGLPKVELLEVQNSVVEPNGILKINFQAKSASTK